MHTGRVSKEVDDLRLELSGKRGEMVGYRLLKIFILAGGFDDYILLQQIISFKIVLILFLTFQLEL